MIFIVTRSSDVLEKHCPFEGCVKRLFPVYEECACTEDHYNMFLSPHERLKWREKGTDHYVDESGHISRRLDDKERWCVEIKDINELMSLRYKTGQNIIIRTDDWHYSGAPVIEIYDTDRE